MSTIQASHIPKFWELRDLDLPNASPGYHLNSWEWLDWCPWSSATWALTPIFFLMEVLRKDKLRKLEFCIVLFCCLYVVFQIEHVDNSVGLWFVKNHQHIINCQIQWGTMRATDQLKKSPQKDIDISSYRWHHEQDKAWHRDNFEPSSLFQCWPIPSVIEMNSKVEPHGAVPRLHRGPTTFDGRWCQGSLLNHVPLRNLSRGFSDHTHAAARSSVCQEAFVYWCEVHCVQKSRRSICGRDEALSDGRWTWS